VTVYLNRDVLGVIDGSGRLRVEIDGLGECELMIERIAGSSTDTKVRSERLRSSRNRSAAPVLD